MDAAEKRTELRSAELLLLLQKKWERAEAGERREREDAPFVLSSFAP